MKGHKFPTSTTGIYTPGTGITITRDNIELAQREKMEREKGNYTPFSPEEIVRQFLPHSVHKPHEFAKYNRYVERASRLMGIPKKAKKAKPKKDADPVESDESS